MFTLRIAFVWTTNQTRINFALGQDSHGIWYAGAELGLCLRTLNFDELRRRIGKVFMEFINQLFIHLFLYPQANDFADE